MDIALAGVLIAVGPLLVKILFGYYLLGSLLSLIPALGRKYVTLGPDGLYFRNWTLIRIPYRDIQGVKALPPGSMARRVLRTFAGNGSRDSDFEVILNRTLWVFLPFPLPVVFPTKRLWLPMRDDAPLEEALNRRLRADSNGRQWQRD